MVDLDLKNSLTLIVHFMKQRLKHIQDSNHTHRNTHFTNDAELLTVNLEHDTIQTQMELKALPENAIITEHI